MWIKGKLKDSIPCLFYHLHLSMSIYTFLSLCLLDSLVGLKLVDIEFKNKRQPVSSTLKHLIFTHLKVPLFLLKRSTVLRMDGRTCHF